MKPVIGRSTGKVDIYAGHWSELGGCRVRMWMETLKRGVEKRVQELEDILVGISLIHLLIYSHLAHEYIFDNT